MAYESLIAVDTLEWSRQRPDRSIDLVFTSPPYEAARTYGIDFNLRGQAWAAKYVVDRNVIAFASEIADGPLRMEIYEAAGHS